MLVTNTQAKGINSQTTPSVDSTGATLLIIGLVWYAFGGGITVSDSKSNTWTGLTTRTAGSDMSSRIFYAANPTVGTGHTFSFTGTGVYAALHASAFDGITTTSPFDQENGSSGQNNTSRQPGSVTPTENSELLYTFLGQESDITSLSIDNGFTIIDTNAYLVSTYYGGGSAYLIQGTAAAINPTWSWTNNALRSAAEIATFKPSAAAGGTGRLLAMERNRLVRVLN